MKAAPNDIANIPAPVKAWKGNKYEPPQNKTNKVTVCPAKTQISLGIFLMDS